MTKARDLANIISGGFDATDIPNLDTAKITSGTFVDARLPATALNSNVDLTTLSASNLTSGTVATARLGSGTADATTFLRGDGSFATPVGGANTPAFSVKQSSAQTGIANTTQTLVTFDTEEFDTDNAFASNKFTVPSGKAGKYYFCATVIFLSSADWDGASLGLWKNGAVQAVSYGRNLYYNTWLVSTVLDLAVNDYIELYVYQTTGGSLN